MPVKTIKLDAENETQGVILRERNKQTVPAAKASIAELAELIRIGDRVALQEGIARVLELMYKLTRKSMM